MKDKTNYSKIPFAIIFGLVFLSLVFFMPNSAFAHGANPSTCQNRYDGPITSAKIIAGGQTYDPIANPGTTFTLYNKQTYQVTFTIHTPSQSSNGNSDPGTTWYNTNAPGYGNGVCVNGAGPNQDVIVSATAGHPSNLAPRGTQTVSWSTFVSGFSYTVNWTDATPSAPTNLTATASSSSQIDLIWTAPTSDGGFPITGYKIERSIDFGSTWSVLVANTGSPSTTYSDTGLQSIPYTYRVSAINSQASGPPSNTATANPGGPTAPPQQPTGLTATIISSSQIYLSWTAPGYDGGSAITGYKIERSIDGGTTWPIVVNTEDASTTYQDSGLTPSTTYTYRVSATNTIGTGPASSTVTSRTPSSTPTAQTYLNDKFDTNLSGWQYYGDPGYQVVADSTTGVPSPSAHISGDAWLGYCSKHGMYKAVDMNSYSGGPLTVGFNWRASSSNSGSTTTISEVRIDNADTGSPLFTERVVNSGTTDTGWQYYTKDVTSYIAGVPRIQVDLYLYDCWASNWNENNWYDNVSLVESASAPGTPSAPTGLTATAASSSQINLSWTAPSNNGGSAITGYKIERSTDNGSTWSVLVANTGNTLTTYSNTGLAASTTYTYRVSAINSVGASSPSNTASATTLAAAPTTVTMLVKSTDMSGNEFSGQWVELWQNGEIIQENFTPFSATLTSNMPYEIYIYDDPGEDKFFNHWEDGSTNQRRTITLSQDSTFTAFFQTTPSGPLPLPLP